MICNMGILSLESSYNDLRQRFNCNVIVIRRGASEKFTTFSQTQNLDVRLPFSFAVTETSVMAKTVSRKSRWTGLNTHFSMSSKQTQTIISRKILVESNQTYFTVISTLTFKQDRIWTYFMFPMDFSFQMARKLFHQTLSILTLNLSSSRYQVVYQEHGIGDQVFVVHSGQLQSLRRVQKRHYDIGHRKKSEFQNNLFYNHIWYFVKFNL